MHSQFKFFIIWFVSLLCAIGFLVATEREIAKIILLLLLVILGAVMMVTTIRDVTLSNASKQWPTTHFDVVSSQIMRATGSSGGNYHAYLELGYQVEGQAYRLDCNNFNIPIHNSVEDAEDYIRKVAAGEFGKDVHYNPENPSLAFVKPGIKPQHVFAIIIALGLIGVPITIMFLQ